MSPAWLAHLINRYGFTPFEIADYLRNAHANVPYTRFFRRAYAARKPPAFLRVLDFRHVRLLTAKVQDQLQHG